MTKQKLFFTCLFIMFMTVVYNTSNAQNVTRDAKGNYTAITAQKKEDKATGNTFTDAKGVVYPVYESSKGRLYVIRVSKASGKQYRQYLKL